MIEPIHFAWDWNIGDVVIATPVCVLIGMLWRFQGLLIYWRIEHEELIVDYCERKGIKVSDMPTRRLKIR